MRAADISGERFVASYHLAAGAGEVARLAESVAIEQTVEFPPDLVRDPLIRAEIFGRVESLRPLGEGVYEARISYAIESAGDELTQLLNVLYGNISLQPGVRLVDFTLPPALLRFYRGPRFGREGLRALVGDPAGPLLCTALKPMGLSPGELAAMAYELALGGVDLVKDDHGLADQPFCRFEDRVAACAAAVARARAETGRPCLYFPNVSAPAHRLRERALFAKAAGAGGLMLAPGLVGFDAMRALADDDSLGLPILMHPSLLGAFSADARHGVAFPALFGLLGRLAGADAVIFPTYGGRFAYSPADCRALAAATARDMAHLAPSFPVPAGGITTDRLPELLAFYGPDTVFLVGGDLHRHPEGLVASCGSFRVGLASSPR